MVNVVVSPALPNRLLVVKKLFLWRLFFLSLCRVDRLLFLRVWRLLDNSVVDELLFMHVDIEVNVDVQVYLILLLRWWVTILSLTWLLRLDVGFGVLLMMLYLASFLFLYILLLNLDDLLVLDRWTLVVLIVKLLLVLQVLEVLLWSIIFLPVQPFNPDLLLVWFNLLIVLSIYLH